MITKHFGPLQIFKNDIVKDMKNVKYYTDKINALKPEEGEEIDDEELLRELQRREAEGMEGSVSFATCLRREGKWMFVSRTQQFAIISWHATDSR